MQEAMDRLDIAKRPPAMIAFGGEPPQMEQTPTHRTSSLIGEKVEKSAAVREGGSLFNFPGKAGIPLQ